MNLPNYQIFACLRHCRRDLRSNHGAREDAVTCEPFSAQFPDNRDKYRGFWAFWPEPFGPTPRGLLRPQATQHVHRGATLVKTAEGLPFKPFLTSRPMERWTMTARLLTTATGHKGLSDLL